MLLPELQYCKAAASEEMDNSEIIRINWHCIGMQRIILRIFSLQDYRRFVLVFTQKRVRQ